MALRRPPSAALAAAASALMLAAGPARGQSSAQLRREVEAVSVVERLGAELPRGGAFTASDGEPFRLGERAGRPLLLSFNYTGCPRLCSLQLAGLARALHDLGWDGDGFEVVTISVDPAEKLPQLARVKQAHLREVGGGPGAERAWTFAAGSREAIDALAEAAGFRYRYDPGTGEFAHQATLVVVTGDGRVSGYLHGIRYPPEALRAALARAAADRVASREEQRSLGGFLLTCMGFNPADPAPLALKVMRTGGVLALGFLLAFLATLASRDLRRRRAGTP